MKVNDVNSTYDSRFGYPVTQCLEERSRWSLLQGLDYLGYIPVAGIAIGAIRAVGSIFVTIVAGVICGVAYYGFNNQPLAKKCSFVVKRAMTEALRGMFQEMILGVTIVGNPLMDRYGHEATSSYGNPEHDGPLPVCARGPVFRISNNRHGDIDYPAAIFSTRVRQEMKMSSLGRSDNYSNQLDRL